MRRLVGWVAIPLATATAIATSGSAAAVPHPAAAAAAGCQVTYTVSSDWGTGFTAAITITNTGPAITSWSLQYSYANGQKLQNGWSATWAQTAA